MKHTTYKQTPAAFTFKYATDSESSILIFPLFFLQTRTSHFCNY